MGDNKIDFFFQKLISGPVKFSAVKGPSEFKGAEFLELLQFVIHWSIEISGTDLLVNDDKKASELKDKLNAAGFRVEPVKIANH